MGAICICHDQATEKSQVYKEITLNGVVITLMQGSPASEQSDVVMLSLDANLQPSGPAAVSAVKKAGVVVQERIREKWRNGGAVPGSVFTCEGGHLLCNEIVFVIHQQDPSPADIQSLYTRVVEEITRRHYQTAVLIPFEPSSGVTAGKQAEVCIHVLADQLRSRKKHKLQQIRIVTPRVGIALAFEEEFDRHFPKWIHSKPLSN